MCYHPNPFISDSERNSHFDSTAAWVQVEALLPELQRCLDQEAMPKSTGKLDGGNSTLYTGLGGIGFTFLRLGLHYRQVRSDEDNARRFLEKAQQCATLCMEREPHSREVAFYCGTPGNMAVAIIASDSLGKFDASSTLLASLLEWSDIACHPATIGSSSTDEMLFGRAGYIYALLFVQKYISAMTSAGFDFVAPLRQVAEAIVSSGKKLVAQSGMRYRGWPLMWHCFDEPYLGAAHGHIGILAMLFLCYEMLSNESQGLVNSTLKALMDLVLPSGNMPICLGDCRDEHLHFCHGAPGLPAMLHAAAKALPAQRESLKEAALKAGEVCWERGLIYKGIGLCHGISGNAYAFLSLHRMTGDAKFLHRAAAFEEMMRDPELLGRVKQQPDPQRRVQGVPDSPCSLMEGSAGVVCFLLDMISQDIAAFPGWEL